MKKFIYLVVFVFTSYLSYANTEITPEVSVKANFDEITTGQLRAILYHKNYDYIGQHWDIKSGISNSNDYFKNIGHFNATEDGDQFEIAFNLLLPNGHFVQCWANNQYPGGLTLPRDKHHFYLLVDIHSNMCGFRLSDPF